MTEKTYHGSMKMSDGSRVALTADEAESLWQAMEKRQADRATRMPDTKSALAELNSAHDRLRELGWHDSRYAPREARFAVCEIGSTGIWSAFRWDAYIHYGDCVTSPGSHMLWKAIDKLDAAERATMEECNRSEAEYIERLGESFGEQN
jgi:hypothetical protein